MRSNNVLYEQLEPRQPGKKGTPKKHGTRFKLSSPTRLSGCCRNLSTLAHKPSTSKPWKGLHLKKLPKLIVMLMQVEFLKPDGKPRYKQGNEITWDRANCRLFASIVQHVFVTVHH
jgi:hypothetical protein